MQNSIFLIFKFSKFEKSYRIRMELEPLNEERKPKREDTRRRD